MESSDAELIYAALLRAERIYEQRELEAARTGDDMALGRSRMLRAFGDIIRTVREEIGRGLVASIPIDPPKMTASPPDLQP